MRRQECASAVKSVPNPRRVVPVTASMMSGLWQRARLVPMSNRILVFYGSYRSDRMGIRLAHFVVEGFRARGDDVELIDARDVNLPMLDRMYKEAPAVLETLAGKIRDADGF